MRLAAREEEENEAMSFGKSTIAVVLISGLGLLACSSSSGGGAATSDGGGGDGASGGGGKDAQPGGDAGGTTADAAGDVLSGGEGGAVPAINSCSAGMYMDMSTGSDSKRMIMMNQSGGGFDMPCMTIAAGQSVMFMWDLATYPIAPGVAPSHAGDPSGTSPNPIQAHNSGSVYTVAFPNAGLFPFYVPGQDTKGLLGVIQVK
jgi:hypothetical protein